MTTNPLEQYFRPAGLNIKLPTGGAYLPAGSFTPNEDGTVAIFPMTAADEYLLKNPDALLSGYAIQKLIESCVPAIKDSNNLSTPDLDVILLAIRAATYGDSMDVQTRCPECKRENDFKADLPALLQTVKEIDPEIEVRLNDDLIVYLRPYSLKNAFQVSHLTFTETRRIQGVEMSEDVTPETIERERRIGYDKLAALQNQIFADCVIRVVAPGIDVSEPEHIIGFMANISRGWVQKIENRILEVMELGMDKTIDVKCQSPVCNHEWQTQIEFDPASFFG